MARTTIAERQARLDQARAKLQREEGRIRDAERKARTRGLIEAGGLIAKAGLGDLEPDALYGALLSLAEGARDSEQVGRWKALGGRAFAREAEQNVQARVPLLLTFEAPPPAHIATHLRALGFRWSQILRHWEGLADPTASAALADEHGGTLRRMDDTPQATG